MLQSAHRASRDVEEERESRVKKSLLQQLSEVNRELWLLLSMLAIAALCNFLLPSSGILLNFYTFPTLFSAYFYGRRHATLTAVGSVLLVVLITYFNPSLFTRGPIVLSDNLQRWCDICIWGGALILTAFAMGALYDRNSARLKELRDTYNGVLVILQHFISKDKYTQNHSYRVSVYAASIAVEMGFDNERVEDVRAAALLHDIGKLDISRELLYKAARLNAEEAEQMKEHVAIGMHLLEPVGGSLRRVLPIILSHHDKYDGSGYTPRAGEDIPLEARILALADAYDAIVADRPYRKGSSPYEAREIIETRAGKEFDPKVVAAFLRAFQKQQLEIPDLVI